MQIPIGTSAQAKGINFSGQVLGTAYFTPTRYHPTKPGKHIPLVHSNGGQIACNATNAGGSEHAVWLTPQN